jgi:uncharacterized protein (TIGR02246 family)
VQTRLERAGGGGASIFAPAALVRVATLTGGIPRLVNVLCDACLMAAFAEGRKQITAAMVDDAWRDSGEQTPAAPSSAPSTTIPPPLPEPPPAVVPAPAPPQDALFEVPPSASAPPPAPPRPAPAPPEPPPTRAGTVSPPPVRPSPARPRSRSWAITLFAVIALAAAVGLRVLARREAPEVRVASAPIVVPTTLAAPVAPPSTVPAPAAAEAPSPATEPPTPASPPPTEVVAEAAPSPPPPKTIAAAPSPPPPDPDAPVTPAEALPLVDEFRAAYESRDTERLVALFAPDATDNGRRGTTAIAEHYRRLFAGTEELRIAMTSVQLVPRDGSVTVRAPYTMRSRGTHGDWSQVDVRGEWRIERRDGRPRIVAFTSEARRPAPSRRRTRARRAAPVESSEEYSEPASPPVPPEPPEPPPPAEPPPPPD